MQLIYWKMQFWCCPRVGHLHPIFKPHRGVFVWMLGPTVGPLQVFQNKMRNARQIPFRWGMGALGIDWAITEDLCIDFVVFFLNSAKIKLHFLKGKLDKWSSTLLPISTPPFSQNFKQVRGAYSEKYGKVLFWNILRWRC